jgi:predicted metal-binding membrane protein
VTAPTEERAHPHDHAPAPSWLRLVRATPMSRARAGILLGLLLLTVGSWWLVIAAPHGAHHSATPTMGMSAPLFLAVWVAMMIATMFPAVAPMLLMIARIDASKRTAGKSCVPNWLFVAGYLIVWTALGVVAYVGAVGAERLAAHIDPIAHNAGRIGGGLILVAGAYQFSTLKDRCLTECRSPLAFVMQHWREGRAGAVRMGIHHGWHCAGCCWALMAMLFPIGMMNIAALATVTAFIYVEKVLPVGRTVGRAAGVGLIAFGLAVIAHPALLPDSLAHHNHADMPAGMHMDRG